MKTLIKNINWKLKGVKTKKEIKEKLALSGAYPPVVILQMGKVASQSIWRSLDKQYQGFVVHTHSFLKKDDFITAKQANKYLKINALCDHFESDDYKGLKIISLVREPIGRNVSAFFQNFNWRTGVKFKDQDFPIEKIRDLFLTKINHEVPLTYFDHFKDKFDIDVYEKPFPAEGHEVIKAPRNVEMLLMRHDLDDDSKERLTGEFMGIKDFKLTNENIASDKIYADTYSRFKSEVKLPAEYISKMKNSRYFQHFYDQYTIDKVCKKWSE
ncbi:MAG: putative capsular polysaccharide synthesis family protein [Marinoscillum sp.]